MSWKSAAFLHYFWDTEQIYYIKNKKINNLSNNLVYSICSSWNEDKIAYIKTWRQSLKKHETLFSSKIILVIKSII